jgi:hypothetical protein
MKNTYNYILYLDFIRSYGLYFKIYFDNIIFYGIHPNSLYIKSFNTENNITISNTFSIFLLNLLKNHAN